MNTKYDDKLKALKWFKLHPQLLPFIGDNYDEYKILQIGESHFIDGKNDNDKFDICYFRDNWWDKTCDELVNSFNDDKYDYCWFDTRAVLQNYLSGNDGSYGIFTNIIKSFSKIMLDKEILHIGKKDKELYHNFSFMNFFQMPSLRNGEKYWNSLVQSAKYEKNENLASETFRKCTEVSIQAIDDVIDIIKPEIIVFTSVSAGNAYSGKEYKECMGKYGNDNRVVYTAHPSTIYWENKKLGKSLGGKTGKEILEEKLSFLK